MRKEFMIIASIVAATFANDARINALGGSTMFDDASFIYSNPAYVTEYKIIQGNITTFQKDVDVDEDGDGIIDYTEIGDEVMGAGIATWHLSDKIVLGGYFNQDSDKAPLFTSTYYANPGRNASPHLLFGMKLSDNFSIGFDGGLEINKKSDKTGAVENMYKSKVLSADLGANLTAGSLDLDISAGIALPSSEVTAKTSTLDTTTHDVSGMVFDVEAYATIGVDKSLDVTAGVMFNTQNMKDNKVDNSLDPKELSLGILAGASKEFEHDMTLGLSAEFGMNKTTNAETDSSDTYTGVLFIAAAEKVFGQTKLFDSHSLRLAYGHAFSKASTVRENGVDTDNTEAKKNGSWSDLEGADDIGLSLGAGFTRGKFGLDFYVSNVNFDFSSQDAGIMDIIPVAGATMTLDFAKKSSPLRNKKGAAADAGNGEW